MLCHLAEHVVPIQKEHEASITCTYCYCYWGLKFHGFDKPPCCINEGTIKICTAQTPTIQRLSGLRDAPTIPISQSKLEVGLFEATFSFELIDMVKISLNLYRPVETTTYTT
jgi:hypothetical protein